MKCDFCQHKQNPPNAAKWITYCLREWRVTAFKGQVVFTDLPEPEVMHFAVCAKCLHVARKTSRNIVEGAAIQKTA